MGSASKSTNLRAIVGPFCREQVTYHATPDRSSHELNAGESTIEGRERAPDVVECLPGCAGGEGDVGPAFRQIGLSEDDVASCIKWRAEAATKSQAIAASCCPLMPTHSHPECGGIVPAFVPAWNPPNLAPSYRMMEGLCCAWPRSTASKGW
jgi:hypothetical protein